MLVNLTVHILHCKVNIESCFFMALNFSTSINEEGSPSERSPSELQPERYGSIRRLNGKFKKIFLISTTWTS